MNEGDTSLSGRKVSRSICSDGPRSVPDVWEQRLGSTGAPKATFVGADPPGLPPWRRIGCCEEFFLEGKYQGDILDSIAAASPHSAAAGDVDDIDTSRVNQRNECEEVHQQKIIV